MKPDVVLVDGKPEHHSEGGYYIDWYEGSRRRRLSVGPDAADAHARRLAKEAELNAINHGVAIAPQNGAARVSLAAAIQDFLEEKRLQHKGKTHADYDTALRYFPAELPQAIPPGDHSQGAALVCCVLPRRTGAVTANRLQQVRSYRCFSEVAQDQSS